MGNVYTVVITFGFRVGTSRGALNLIHITHK